MRKYPSFCLRQKSPPAGRVSGWAGKAVHVLGKALILCWCAFTVALIGWVVLASFTPGKRYDCVVVSTPELRQGGTYTVTAGGETTSVTLDSLIYGSSGGMNGGE